MSVAPTGDLSLRLSKIRALLAASATFQTWVSAENAAAALARIYVTQLPTSGAITRPFGIVDNAESYRREALAVGMHHILPGSSFLILLEANSGQEDPADSYYTFANAVGAIVDEMFDLSGTLTHPSVHAISFAQPPARSDPKSGEVDPAGDTAEDYWQVVLLVELNF